MRVVLHPDLAFADVERALTSEGWARVAVPGLLPPLVPGEHEQARFEYGSKLVVCSFNPAVRLRVVEGDVESLPPMLHQVDGNNIAQWLAGETDEQILLGCLAAEQLQLVELCTQVEAAIDRLSPEARPHGLDAQRRLGHVNAAESNPESVREQREIPVLEHRQMLRRALHRRAEVGNDPIAMALRSSDAELAATGLVAAARLGRTELGALSAKARVDVDGMSRAEDALLRELKQLCLRTLSGERPDGGTAGRDLFWRAMLGERLSADQIDDQLLLLVTLATPAAIPTFENSPRRFCRVRVVEHWLGHGAASGRPNPIRRWTPEAPFLVAAVPEGDPMTAAQWLDRIARESDATTWPISTSEWEAALRGTDARLRPWGLGRTAIDLRSPWGARLGPPGVGEWALDEHGVPVVVGKDRTGRVAYQVVADHNDSALMRVIQAQT